MKHLNAEKFVKILYPESVCHKYHNDNYNLVWYTIFTGIDKISQILGCSCVTEDKAWKSAAGEINKKIIEKLES